MNLAIITLSSLPALKVTSYRSSSETSLSLFTQLPAHFVCLFFFPDDIREKASNRHRSRLLTPCSFVPKGGLCSTEHRHNPIFADLSNGTPGN